MTNSTISGNFAGANAGGIANYGQTLTMTNSTISGNTADSFGGGIANAFNATLTMTNSTITWNTAREGGGIMNFEGPISLKNSINAENTASSSGPDCSGDHTSLGYNLIGDGNGCEFQAATADQVGDGANPIDPVLGPLLGNGGPTFTHALLPGSPAMDAGDDAACPPADQRRVARPVDGDGNGVATCDIGAFEFAIDPNFLPTAFDQTVTTVADSPVTIVLTASDWDTGDTLSFGIVSLPAGGDLFEGGTASGEKIIAGDHVLIGDTVTYKASFGFAGADSFEFTANDGTADSNVATVAIMVNEPVVKGAVVFEGMPNPISGARVTFSGDGVVEVLTSDPASGNFQIQLPPGIYTVTIEKDGFLKATKTGVVVNNDTVLPPARLLFGDADGNGIIDVKDLSFPAKNLGAEESPWE